MARDFDIVVLGLGGIGSGAAYWLARRGKSSVLGLEQFELGHVRGESQDHSRIIRLSYHAPHYVRLAKRAYESWATLETESNTRVVLKTGGLDLQGPARGRDSAFSGYADAMAACGVDFERVDAAEIMRRWPQFTLSDDIEGLFQAESGIAMARARERYAPSHGARQRRGLARQRAPVERIVDRDGEIEVRRGRHHVPVRQS